MNGQWPQSAQIQQAWRFLQDQAFVTRRCKVMSMLLLIPPHLSQGDKGTRGSDAKSGLSYLWQSYIKGLKTTI